MEATIVKRCAGGALVLMAVLATARAEDKTLSVQVREAPVRASPAFIGRIVADLSYGDRVQATEQKAAWVKVAAAGGVSGWVHQSALTEKRIVIGAGSADVATGASSGELALAGKGFNSDVEAQFKAQNRDIDFTPVNRMERARITQEEMTAFLKEGGIGRTTEGGAQ